MRPLLHLGPNVITERTFITLGFKILLRMGLLLRLHGSKLMLLQMRPLLRLGPVITLVHSIPVRLVRWKWKCRNDGKVFFMRVMILSYLSSEHFDLISVVCKSPYHENVFLFFKHFVKVRLLHSVNLREKGHDIYVFVQQLSTPQK